MHSVLFRFSVAAITFVVGVIFAFPSDSFVAVTSLDHSFVFHETSCPGYVPVTKLEVGNEADDAYSVYSAILDKRWSSSERIYVVDELTSYRGSLMDAMIEQRDIPGASRETIAGFEKSNAANVNIRSILASRSDVMFYNDEVASKFRKNNRSYGEMDWRAFEKAYRGSHKIFTFSNIGFNAERDQALVYMSYYCGSLCAGGSFIILEKNKDEWSISRENEIWVS